MAREAGDLPSLNGAMRTPSYLPYLQTGLQQVKAGKYTSAIRDLRKSRKLKATDTNQFLLGVAHFMTGAFYEAISVLKPKMQDRDLAAKGSYVRALCQGQCGMTDSALEALDRIIDAEPTMGDAYVSKGALLAADGDLKGARSVWEEGKRQAGPTARLLACEGFACLADNRGGDAVFTLQQAVRKDPEDLVAKFFLASALEATGKVTAAKRAYTDYIKANPTSAQALYFRGRLAAKARDLKGCVADMTSALTIDKGCLAAAIARGVAYMRADKLREAFKDLEHACNLIDPREDLVALFTPPDAVADSAANTVMVKTIRPSIASLLANVAIRLKKYDAAKKALSVVLKYRPSDATSYYYRSICNERTGNSSGALRDASKAERLDSENEVYKKRRQYMQYTLSQV